MSVNGCFCCLLPIAKGNSLTRNKFMYIKCKSYFQEESYLVKRDNKCAIHAIQIICFDSNAQLGNFRQDIAEEPVPYQIVGENSLLIVSELKRSYVSKKGVRKRKVLTKEFTRFFFVNSSFKYSLYSCYHEVESAKHFFQKQSSRGVAIHNSHKYKTGVLKICRKFTREHPYRIVISKKAATGGVL